MSSARAEADCKEFFDSPDELHKKIKQLAELVKKSEHFCAFTGAGISTSAGIADFRSGINTVLDTGAGKWAKNSAVKKGKTVKSGKRKVDSMKAYPTPSHMALVQLMKSGYLKYLISQNTDGLHRRSLIPIDKLSELHGNRTLEVCDKCNKSYMRDYCCRNSVIKQKVHDHKTTRKCTVKKCNGNLCDTIINFGESLPEIPLKKAFSNSNHCDLMLCLGSSLTVSPACDMPTAVGKKSKKEKTKEKKHNVVIVNLQKTPLHSLASLNIFAKIDDVMTGLMKELNMKIPKWYLLRYIKLISIPINDINNSNKIIISSVDRDGTKFTLFEMVKLKNNGKGLRKYINNKENEDDEYAYHYTTNNDNEQKQQQNDLSVDLSFHGNYDEPKLSINLNEYIDDLKESNKQIILKMIFDPFEKKWNVPNKTEQLKDENVKKLWSI